MIKGLNNNFELQNVTLNNDLTFNAVEGKHSAFVLTIKTTSQTQYSESVSTQNLPFSNFTSFKTLPSDSIITFELPLTFQLPPTTTPDIYQPSYVLSSTYAKTTDANPSLVLMNNLDQFNPLVSWQIPPYKQGASVGTYPTSVGTVVGFGR